MCRILVIQGQNWSKFWFYKVKILDLVLQGHNLSEFCLFQVKMCRILVLQGQNWSKFWIWSYRDTICQNFVYFRSKCVEFWFYKVKILDLVLQGHNFSEFCLFRSKWVEYWFHSVKISQSFGYFGLRVKQIIVSLNFIFNVNILVSTDALCFLTVMWQQGPSADAWLTRIEWLWWYLM